VIRVSKLPLKRGASCPCKSQIFQIRTIRTMLLMLPKPPMLLMRLAQAGRLAGEGSSGFMPCDHSFPLPLPWGAREAVGDRPPSGRGRSTQPSLTRFDLSWQGSSSELDLARGHPGSKLFLSEPALARPVRGAQPLRLRTGPSAQTARPLSSPQTEKSEPPESPAYPA
jgi:hypothetical protein